MSKKTIFVTFANHFDLIWRRCWDRDYTYMGGRYLSYRRVEELWLQKNIELAEKGQGAFVLEQSLSMRAFLQKHPAALSRLQALYRKGLFEILGAGEAIIDVNMCGMETMARNLASGKRYALDVLSMKPLLANHGDGFGSSAQFPQAIRQCGYQGVAGLSYCRPDKPYWRGLDGSVVLSADTPIAKSYFFDHCYHEPCRVCRGFRPAKCMACKGMGVDLPQNTYPPFEPVPPASVKEDATHYSIASEEMLPPEGFAKLLKKWNAEQDEYEYRFGTPSALAGAWEPKAALVDTPPPDQISSRVENVPTQAGCYVSRIRMKQQARELESVFYGWEKAVMATAGKVLDRKRWENLFLELPLVFFHDAITGTHNDEAYIELMDRMRDGMAAVRKAAIVSLGKAWGRALKDADVRASASLAVFNPHAGRDIALRIPADVADWRKARPLVAIAQDGRRFPVVYPTHAFSPPIHSDPRRLVDAVGPTARTRPTSGKAFVEARGLPPLAWTRLKLAAARLPEPLTPLAGGGHVIENEHTRVECGPTGIQAIMDRATRATITADALSIGEVIVEEDEGDPWATRRIPKARRFMGQYTKCLGALRFEGYQEAYFAGRYEANLTFAREEDPKIFPLDWYVTVRLLDDARRVDFQFEIYWKAVDRRLRVAFPTQATSDTGWYSVPGGWVKRDRHEQEKTWVASPNGDWPALYFHATQPSGGKPGWALVNYGTPAARIEDGRLIASVVRAPGFGHCLERYAQDYPMPTSGMRDGGWHHFTFSLMPYDSESSLPALSLAATALNQAAPAMRAPVSALPFEPPFRIDGEGVEVVAIKPGFRPRDKDSVVVRLLNHRAEATTVGIVFMAWRPSAATVVNLLEDLIGDLHIEKNLVLLTFKAFECKTLRLSLGPRMDEKAEEDVLYQATQSVE